MTEDVNKEKIKATIAALLAKAEGTDNIHEAETFLNKVNEMLLKYQIERHELKQGKADPDPMGKTDGATYTHDTMTWALNVGGALAKLYGAHLRYRSVGNKRPYIVYGPESARTTFEMMFPYIIQQVRSYSKGYAHDNNISTQVAQRHVGLALSARILEMCEAAEEQRSVATKNALVPFVDSKAYADEVAGKALGRGRVKRYHSSARAVADKVSLNHQATHTRREKIGA